MGAACRCPWAAVPGLRARTRTARSRSLAIHAAAARSRASPRFFEAGRTTRVSARSSRTSTGTARRTRRTAATRPCTCRTACPSPAHGAQPLIMACAGAGLGFGWQGTSRSFGKAALHMSRQDRSRCCAGRTIAVGFGSTQPVSSSSVHSMPWSYTCLAQQSSPPGCDQQSTPPQRSHVSGQQTLASTALFEGSSAKCTCPIFPIEHSSATAVTVSVSRATIQDRAGIGLNGRARSSGPRA